MAGAPEVQAVFAGAWQVQPDSAASQQQRLAQVQAAPLAWRLGVADPLHPQAQVLPGQLAHWQAEANWWFMAYVLSGWRTRRVRGNEFWSRDAPQA
jgi:hypothetical protein